MSSRACHQMVQARFTQIQCRQTIPHTTLLKASPFFLYNDHTRQSLRASTNGSPQICIRQRRTFTSSVSKRAGSRMPTMKSKTAPSMARTNKELIQQAMKEGKMLDYVGVIDDTFIAPTLPEINYTDLGSLPKALGARWKLLQQSLWSRMVDLWSLYWQGRWKMKPPLPITPRKEIKDIAKQMYEDIYTAFGEGDLELVKKKLAPGFYESLTKHILERQPDTVRKWRLERYVREPKVVSYRFGPIPAEGEAAKKSKAEQAADTMGMVQAVVQIHSVQSLLTVRTTREWDAVTRRTITRVVPLNQRGVEISEGGAEEVRRASAKETIEYFVIQRKVLHSKTQPWEAWGMTTESTPEVLRAQAGIRAVKMKELQRRRAAGEL